MAVEIAGFDTVPGPVDNSAQREKSVLENGKPDEDLAPVDNSAEGEKSVLENKKPDEDLAPVENASEGEKSVLENGKPDEDSAPVENVSEGEKSVLENGKPDEDLAPVENASEEEKSVLENGKPDEDLAPVENASEVEKSVLENGKSEEDLAPVEKTAEGENLKPDQESNDDKPIVFDSHGEELVKANDVLAVDTPKNPSNDWSSPSQIYSFYLPKVRQYDDPQIKAKINEADKEISKINHARLQTTDALKAKRSKRAEVVSQLKDLRNDNRQIRNIMDEKMREREPLQYALSKLRNSNVAGHVGGLCSSEEELNELIQALQYRIQHESISLSEEKQLLREIKQIEGTRKDVIAYAAERVKLQESFGPKESIQDQVKLIGGDLEGVRKEKQVVQAKIKQLDEAIKQIDKGILSQQEDLANITQKREKVFKGIQQLRTQRDDKNAHYYQYRKVFMEARVLATKKDVKALLKLVEEEGEKFINLWSSDKAFRDDYLKRILQSLDNRQLSRDGRIRNADEKPLVAVELPTSTARQSLSNSSMKHPEENSQTAPKDSLPANKVHKEADKGKELKSILKSDDLGEADTFELEKPKKETPAEDPVVDKEKLKEMKRQEEISKAKQTIERKKKLAEKAAAKAAVRAQKEAEKKLKEREKKAKKKAGSSATVSNSEETAEAPAVSIVREKSVETPEAPVQEKEKVQKQNPVWFRGQSKAPKSIPKAILKRKRSNNNWIWGAAGASLVLMILVFLYTHGF